MRRTRIYFLGLVAAADKVYVDFIVHSFITTELCFYEHYLCAPIREAFSSPRPPFISFPRFIAALY